MLKIRHKSDVRTYPRKEILSLIISGERSKRVIQVRQSYSKQREGVVFCLLKANSGDTMRFNINTKEKTVLLESISHEAAAGTLVVGSTDSRFWRLSFKQFDIQYMLEDNRDVFFVDDTNNWNQYLVYLKNNKVEYIATVDEFDVSKSRLEIKSEELTSEILSQAEYQLWDGCGNVLNDDFKMTPKEDILIDKIKGVEFREFPSDLLEPVLAFRDLHNKSAELSSKLGTRPYNKIRLLEKLSSYDTENKENNIR